MTDHADRANARQASSQPATTSQPPPSVPGLVPEAGAGSGQALEPPASVSFRVLRRKRPAPTPPGTEPAHAASGGQESGQAPTLLAAAAGQAGPAMESQGWQAVAGALTLT